MAELDKNLLMGMLQNLLGDNGNDSAPKENSDFQPLESENKTVSLPVSSSPKEMDDFINTAEMMSKFTDLMGKFRQASNTQEAALLSALRPYLRSSRQPKVDTMLRALQAYRVFSEMKKSNSKDT
ncbi:MAG: hypothetical protein E7413_05310 [Ruminococcaceae bacterium]|nr:hypothetical protein [Oscillospiraceae bacterium]